jgi:chemotaxis protein methyltransferase WspC
MTGKEIEELLQKTIGLKVASIGTQTLDRSVQRRMKALSIDDKNKYIKKLKSSAVELQYLIEEVVIPETWFFRDRQPFIALTQYLVTHWAQNHESSLFKVLSVPCSTGEEPYSIAMTLLNSGWPTEKFIVHAADISHRLITRAKEGVYSENSFRGSDLEYRSRYFQKNLKHYILKKFVREKVHFHTGNILNKAFMKSLGLFDAIFFRNVLIYLDQHSRRQILDTLHEILNDDGLLIVGHAEANLLSNFSYTPAPYPQAFTFFKKSGQQLQSESHKRDLPELPKAKPIPVTAKRPFSSSKQSEKKLSDLKLARELANKGELQKANIICQKYLEDNGPSAQAFSLLGIINDAANNASEAEKSFRKAIYLDPNHEEALVFLSLLTEKSGNVNELKTLKKRIERVQEQKPSQPHESSDNLSDRLKD